MHVLLIEDNAETAAYLTQGFAEQGWTAEHFTETSGAMLRLAETRFDAVILDRMLPASTASPRCALMRAANVTTPVLMLTARSGIGDRVEGLDAGADDYLVKPFALSELLARIRSLARRPTLQAEPAELRVADLTLDPVRRTATRAGQPIDLSPLEFKLLHCLMAHAGQVVTRTMLLERVWGYGFDPKTSLVQTHVSRLRAKLDRGFPAGLISTVRGVGYVLAAPE